MTLVNSLRGRQRYTLTENMALAYNTTGSPLLDLFGSCGGMRHTPEENIRLMFHKALNEDRQLAARLAFWCRDARDGAGERRTGRIMLEILAQRETDSMRELLPLIPEYGRWDDLLVLLGTPLHEDVLKLIEKQLKEDIENMQKEKPVSLLAKWLPSINASSRKTREDARIILSYLKMSEKEYRHTLSSLRSYLNITEKNLSEKEYGRIVYPEVPSCAMHRYRNAFRSHDEERFDAFLDNVSKGEEKINSSVLYPYDITEKYLYSLKRPDSVLEEQWKALPDYVSDGRDILVMADVSGSMHGRPMATSVGLAIYFAERCHGPFHNRFMTFSFRPELVEVKGDTLFAKVQNVQNANWEMNTDIEAAFMAILDAAVSAHLPQEELPDTLLIISDMQFDYCTSSTDCLITDEMKNRYKAYGYTLPELVFWNVDSRRNTFFADPDTEGIKMASGHSPSLFASLCKDESVTPYGFMCSVLNSKRYEKIAIKPTV